MIEKQLENLISQTEYTLAVTPIYDEGAGQPMTGSAITGMNDNHSVTENIVLVEQIPDAIKL